MVVTVFFIREDVAVPFIPTPIAGALSVIHNTRRNVERAGSAGVPAVSDDAVERKVAERPAWKALFFGPGR